MFRHLIKIAIRNFIRHKSFAFINIFGLSFGLACFILITLFVQYEFSYDKFNEHYERIYRVQLIAHMADGDEYWSQVGYPVGDAMKQKYGEIEEFVVTRPVWGEYLSSSEKLTFFESDGQYADSTFFNVFTATFIEGSKQGALKEPYSIVLTRSLKEKYFGEGPALGKFIKAKNRYELKVTAVIEDFPESTTLVTDYISPIQLIEINDSYAELKDQWDNMSYYTYILANPHVSKEELDAKMGSFLMENENFKDNPTKYTVWFNPITSLHLLPDPMEPGLLIIVYMYSGVAIFALLIACINFMNLTTAYSVSRAKEIGIKKVVGSSRHSLTSQFLFESILVSAASMILAFIIAEIALPYFNLVVSRQLELSLIGDWKFTLFICGVALFTGILAGAYPAFHLSGFKPSRALKSASSLSNTRSPLRRVLVTFQFVISSILILSTIVIYNQFTYMRDKEVGFDKEYLMYSYIGAEKKEASRKLDLIKNRLGQIPEVEIATVSWTIPFHSSSGSNVTWEGGLAR